MSVLTPAGKAFQNTPLIGGMGTDSFKKGLMGQNQADFGESRLNTERSDQERALGLQSRGLQEQYGGLLQAQMAGRGPSVAGAQLAQGRDAAVRAAMTAAASARGANVGLAGRAAATGAAGATMQSARDAAVLRAQEQLAAQQQYGALLQAQRQQDLLSRGITSEGERAQLQAGTAYNALAEKAGEANAKNEQDFMGGIVTGVGGILKSDVRAKTDVQPVGYTPWWLQPAQPNLAYSPGQLDSVQKQLADQESQQPVYQPPPEAPAQGNGGLGGLLQNIGGGMIKSDPETKDGATSQGHGALVKAAAAVQPYSFRYKPEAAAQQGVTTEQRVGVMANGGPGSLESNPVYAPAVSVGPDGFKRVDSGQATMANIAVTSDLAKKVEEQGAELAALRHAYAGTQSAAITSRDYERQQHLNPGLVGPPRREFASYLDTPAEGEAAKQQDVAPYNANRFASKQFGAHPALARAASATQLTRPTMREEMSDKLLPGQVPETVGGEPVFGESERQRYNVEHAGRIEQRLGDTAAALKGAKPEQQRALIRSYAVKLRGAPGGTPNPRYVIDSLQARGVKVSPKAVKDALRQETEL